MDRMFTSNMMGSKSASYTEAQSSCAKNGSFCMHLIPDAMIVASIIIALISIISLGLAGLLGIRGLLLGVILILAAGIVLVGNEIQIARKHGRF